MTDLPPAAPSVVERLPRALGLAAGLLYTLYVLWTALILWLVGALGCDEGCLPAGEATSWQDERGAWQWLVLLGLALAVGATGMAYFLALLGRYRRGALAAWLLHPLLFLAGLLWKDGSLSSADLPDAQVLAWWFFGAAAGLLAIGLAGTPSDPDSPRLRRRRAAVRR